MARSRRRTKPYLKKSTPTKLVEARELTGTETIRTRSGAVLKLTAARKRSGVVRCQFEGKIGVFDLPRAAPIEVFEVAA